MFELLRLLLSFRLPLLLLLGGFYFCCLSSLVLEFYRWMRP